MPLLLSHASSSALVVGVDEKASVRRSFGPSLSFHHKLVASSNVFYYSLKMSFALSQALADIMSRDDTLQDQGESDAHPDLIPVPAEVAASPFAPSQEENTSVKKRKRLLNKSPGAGVADDALEGLVGEAPEAGVLAGQAAGDGVEEVAAAHGPSDAPQGPIPVPSEVSASQLTPSQKEHSTVRKRKRLAAKTSEVAVPGGVDGGVSVELVVGGGDGGVAAVSQEDTQPVEDPPDSPLALAPMALEVPASQLAPFQEVGDDIEEVAAMSQNDTQHAQASSDVPRGLMPVPSRVAAS